MRIQNPESRSFFKKSFTILNSAFWILSSLAAQQKNLPLNRENLIPIDIFFNQIDSINSLNRYTAFKPFNCNCLISDEKKDSNEIIINITCPKSSFVKHRKLYRKLKEESLIIVNDSADKFLLTIDPLFNFEFGRDLGSADTIPEKLYKNTRGVLIRGDIGKKFSFESSFSENQATFVKYLDDYIKSTNNLFSNPINYQYNVIPGQGRAKTFKKTGYDFAMASGYISYSPSNHFNFQLGTGKHFVGDGYRSLLLSDNTFNYPFARITTSFGKFQYTNLYTSFMNLTDGGVKTPPGTERLFQKKAGSFQFLSWNIHKRIQLGFFQGMIWKSADSANKTYLNGSYFNPILFVSAVEFGLQNENNILLGSTLKFKITNSISVYGQYMLDDEADFGLNFLHNKQGFQLGAKYFDVLGLKNLHIQLEYNQVRPYSYSSKKPSQSYTHYNQPLAHPLGANFRETIALLNYRIGDFFTEIKMNYAKTGKDFGLPHNLNYGSNIFRPDNMSLPFGSYLLQGSETTIKIIHAHIGYLVNPSTNFNIVSGISNRITSNSIANSRTNYVYFGIRTSLSNVYYDF